MRRIILSPRFTLRNVLLLRLVFFLSSFPTITAFECFQPSDGSSLGLGVKTMLRSPDDPQFNPTLHTHFEETYGPNLAGWCVDHVESFARIFRDDPTMFHVPLPNVSDMPLVNVSAWNTSSAKSLVSLFENADRIRIVGLGLWDVSNVVDMSCLFCQANLQTLLYHNSGFGSNDNDLSRWNTGKVTSLQQMAHEAKFSSSLNKEDVEATAESYSWLGKWDVSQVQDFPFALASSTLPSLNVLSQWNTQAGTNFKAMFQSARYFSSDLSQWNLSQAVDLSGMFYLAGSFNSDLSKWDVSKVTSMEKLFGYTAVFESDLSDWDVSRVQQFGEMFEAASSFQSDLSQWDVTNKVTSLNRMFWGATRWDSNLSQWNIENVELLQLTFANSSFQGVGLENWDVSKVRDMNRLCLGATQFDGDLSRWNVSQVTTIKSAFRGATQFRGRGLSRWNVESVQDMEATFEGAVRFNEDVSGWDVRQSHSLERLFSNAAAFNQDLCAWRERLNTHAAVTYMFANTACPNRSPPSPRTSTDSHGEQNWVGPFCWECSAGDRTRNTPSPGATPFSSSSEPSASPSNKAQTRDSNDFDAGQEENASKEEGSWASRVLMIPALLAVAVVVLWSSLGRRFCDCRRRNYRGVERHGEELELSASTGSGF